MRTVIISGLILSVSLISCKNQNEKQNVLSKDSYEKHNEVLESTLHCYLFSNGKDSIRLSYTQEGNEIDGWMNYDFFEKDGSVGEVDGEFFGDTLKLEYEFLSEGKISKQQVYFLKKDNFKLYRGTGDMKMTSDSVMVYSNPKEISFSDNTPLGELKNCPDNFIKQENIDFYKKESDRRD